MMHRMIVLFVALLLAPRLQAAEFRFAVLSDTHVGNPSGAEDLRRSVDDLNHQRDVGFVILSGDITEFGSDRELEEAHAILESLRHPYVIIPGNHDTKWSESGCTSFARIFGADRFVVQHGGIVFVGLHQGPVMRMADGHFAPEDILWLDSVLTTIPGSTPLVFVSHYPLDPGIDNWYEATDRLRQHKTLVILQGHGHRNRASVQDGIPAVMVRSNLRGRDDLGGYTIVDVRGDSLLFTEKRPGKPAGAPWHVVGPEDRARAREHDLEPRPDFSVNDRPGTPREIWNIHCGATVTTPPALLDDLVIVGDALGRVRALDLESGELRWEYRADGPVHSAPAADRGRIVFGSAGGTVYCLSARSGQKIWTVTARGPVLGAPRIAGGMVYIGASDGAFRAIDLESGALRWEYTHLEGFVESRPLVADSLVIFGAWDSYLYALETATGNLRWKWSNGSPAIGLSPAACWPVTADGTVFVVAPDRFMTALQLATGREIWRSPRYQVREAIGISADNRTVFARTMQDTVIAVRAAADTMAVEWLTDAGFGYDFAACMLIEDQGEVLFGTKNGLLLALDRADGHLLWQRKVGVTALATPVPAPGGLLVSDLDGKVVRLKRVSR